MNGAAPLDDSLGAVEEVEQPGMRARGGAADASAAMLASASAARASSRSVGAPSPRARVAASSSFKISALRESSASAFIPPIVAFAARSGQTLAGSRDPLVREARSSQESGQRPEDDGEGTQRVRHEGSHRSITSLAQAFASCLNTVRFCVNLSRFLLSRLRVTSLISFSKHPSIFPRFAGGIVAAICAFSSTY